MKPGQPFARLVLAPAHKALVLQARAQAEACILVTSHRLSIAARQAVLIPLTRPAIEGGAGSDFETRLFYGHEPEANRIRAPDVNVPLVASTRVSPSAIASKLR